MLLLTWQSFGQSPQGFKYQAVVRNADGILLYNQVVSVKSSILADSPTGTAVYSETQTLATNEYGVVSLNVGEGTVLSGTFGSIAWGATTYFLKTELDLSGGSNFQFMGTSQIMSVPYALYAAKAGASVNDQDTSASNEIQTLSVSGNNLSISNGNEVVIDSNPSNELQTLTLAGHNLTLSDGNTVTLPPDSDNDPSNEFQTLSIVGDSLKLTNGNAVYLSGNIDLDASPTNELQLLSKSGDTLFLSNGNFVVLDHDIDLDSTNEVQTLYNTAGSISISKGNTIYLEDSSATNELQTLSLQNDTLKISNGNSVILPDADSNNEIQTLSLVGDSLHISNGNTVKIKSQEHYIGELWGGGIVCHVFRDSLGIQHGLVMSRHVISYSPWHSLNSLSNGINTLNFSDNWDGLSNSVGAFSVLQQNATAVLTCLNYSSSDYSGTYDDWYLPSIGELNSMLSNVFSLKLQYSDINFNYGTNDSYWSSTCNMGSSAQYSIDIWISICDFNGALLTNLLSGGSCCKPIIAFRKF